MSGIALHYAFSGDLHAGLDRLIAAGGNLSPVMLRASAIMYEATMDRFEDEADPLGVPWAKSVRAMADGGKTLQESRQLKDSIMPQSDRDTATVGVRGDAQSLGRAPVRDYARIHQDGGIIRPRVKRALSWAAGIAVALVRMPRRAYLGFGAGEVRDIDAALAAHLEHAWANGAGGPAA